METGSNETSSFETSADSRVSGPILVTGGFGFLGSHVVAELLRTDIPVRVLSRPPRSRRIPPVLYDEEARSAASVDVIWGDIRDAAVVEEAVDSCEAVIHLVSNFRSAREDGREAREVNVGGTENVLAAAEEAGVQQILHCSTIGVHGDVDEIPADEMTEFNPGDSYQRTKLAGEKKVWEHYRRTGQSVTVIRPISMFGPGDRRMLKLFRMIDAGWFVRVGDGEVYFQPAYIDDVVKGFMLSLGNEDAVGEAFIIGGAEYVTLNDLADVVGEELGVEWRTLPLPMKPLLAAATLCEWICSPLGVEPPLHRRRVSFYQNDRAFSVEKARRVLGFEPEMSLREGIRRTIEAYRKEGWL